MSTASKHSYKLGRTRSSAPMLDKFAIAPPLAACAYALIVSPLLIYSHPVATTGLSVASKFQTIMTPRPENKIVWPLLAAISVFLALRNWSRLTWPPHIICLLAYLVLAGASVLWAFKPE